MATVTFGAATNADSGNVNNYSVTTATATNDLLVVFFSVTGTVETATDATDDNSSGTYTLIASATRNTSTHTQYLLVRDTLIASGANTIITCNLPTDAGTGAEIHAYRVAGMSRTGASAVRQTAKQDNQASGGTPAPAFSASALTDNVTLGCISNAVNPAAMTPPTDWTEGADGGHGTPNGGTESVYRNSGFTGTTITWGSTSGGTFSSLIVELDTSAAASGSLVVPSMSTMQRLVATR